MRRTPSIRRTLPLAVAACLVAATGAACSSAPSATGSPTPVRATPVSRSSPTAQPSPTTSAVPSPSVAPTPSAAPSPSIEPVVAPAACHPSTAGSTIRLASTQFLFSTRCLGVAAGAPFVIRYRNRGGLGNPDHNVSIYRDAGGLFPAFRGGIVLTGQSHAYHVKALAPGTYLYLCDLHPDTMRGFLVVG